MIDSKVEPKAEVHDSLCPAETALAEQAARILVSNPTNEQAKHYIDNHCRSKLLAIFELKHCRHFTQDVGRDRSSSGIVRTSSSPHCLLRRCETVLVVEYILRGVISTDSVVRSLHTTARGTSTERYWSTPTLPKMRWYGFQR